MDFFKENEELEKRVLSVFLPLFGQQNQDRIEFFNEAYKAAPLGDVLFELDRSPIAKAISQQVFRNAFYAIHQIFTRPGTFDFYMEVFKAIFGDNVEVEFIVPGPGHLQINVSTLNAETVFFMAREIENGAYQYHEVIDEVGDNIMFQIARGPRTQSEMDAIMNEIKPSGIFVETELVV